MPRRPRICVEGAVYHVYNRFARGDELFVADDEVQRFLGLLLHARVRDGLSVLAWCVMSNHYHLAVLTGAVPLARTLGYVQSRFGQDYNRRRSSAGPLWQGRYKAKLVEGERHLLALIAYVHLNPVAAGLVGRPGDHRWSGHREITGEIPSGLVNVDATLAFFGEHRKAATRAYLAALERDGVQPWVARRPGQLPWWGPEPDRPTVPAPALDALGRTPGLLRRRLSAGEFLSAACGQRGIDPDNVLGRATDRATSTERFLICALAVERWGVRTKALADLVGRRADVVTRWCRRGAELRQRDRAFAADFEALDHALAERCWAGSAVLS